MKKLTKLLIPVAMILLIAMSLTVDACATTVTWRMAVGDTYALMSQTPYVSSNTNVIEIRYEGGCNYVAVAVGVGKATVSGGSWMGSADADYEFTVTSKDAASEIIQDYFDGVNEMQKEHNDRVDAMQDGMDGFFVFSIVLAFIALSLAVAAIIYIYIVAPKCGMSRFWALVPLFSSVLGLLVFIVVRSNRKTTSTANTIVCPTCNGVHPVGTTVCSICGTELQ